MNTLVSTLLFEPPGKEFGQLRREFRAEVPPQWGVYLVSSPQELLDFVADNSCHHLVVLPDEWDGGQTAGLELIPSIRKASPDTPIVVVAEAGNVDRAARAIAAGATDFLVRGADLRQRIATLLGKLRGLFDMIDRNRLLGEDLASLREKIEGPLRIVGQSPPMRRLLEQICRVAAIPRPVLIVGPRGTGKELVARAIHCAGGPASRPMVTVNCAAFSDALLESELFGHEKGAFTGADALRRGKFEQADGGTLFLDEIGHMSPAFQEKILRAVEYGAFTRVGGVEELHSTARIIAATNRDLRDQIARGRFLADLYDRLAFETLEIPPLQERPGDIELLAQHFLDQFAREIPAFAGKTLSPAALAALRAYPFPGNVRELKNIIERAAYRETGREIAPEDLGLTAPDVPVECPGTFQEKTDAFARRLIHDALGQAAGNQAQAARSLGLSYHQFRYYLKKYPPGNDATY
jgi:DNA-binding NtrC family response regulator